ncbi:nidogen-like isoform X4 [Acropora muricata]|uniref:nidogen-like isoform X4 n=1 Tax=Acropora muricata TaxID=159855 RepID=UPI0034E51B44
MLSTLIFLQLLTLGGGVRLNYLFPFGEAHGDVKLSHYKRQSFRGVVNLNGTYSFYSKRFSALQVHHEGLIIFGKEAFLNTTFRHKNFAFLPNTPSLAVFYAPVHYFSNVFSRETRDKDVIERATTYVRFSFVEDTAFSASHVFIVTWSNATRAYDRFPDEVNSFQVVLITNGMTTFAMLNYQNSGLERIMSYPVRFHGGRSFYAQVGFSAGDQVRYYLLPGSGTMNVTLLLTKSNMMLPGQWMFKIGWPTLKGPLNIESANSFIRKESARRHHFILDQHIDECSSGVSQCHEHASCTNSDPGYCCECNEGYFGTGFICEKEGENLRFSGRMTGKINSVDVPSINVDIIAITKDGRAYVVIRDPPASLQHSLKILTPFVSLVGWMFAVKKTMGVRNGIQVIGEKFTRSAIISFNSGEALYLNQRFTGKDATGSYISIVTTINGTMPNINADARVQVSSFQEIYQRRERGRVESNGAVSYSVDGQAQSFFVQQIITYDEPRGCHVNIYSVNVESKLLLSKYDAKQGYTGIAIKTSIVNGSLSETRDKCEGVTCGRNASCDDTGRCVCYQGFQGDGQRCKDVNECIEGNDCDEFADCKNSYGSYSCSCKDGYRGNGKECIKVTVTGRCSRENCDVYASCLADPLSGIANCACQIGFIGDGLKCQDVNECVASVDICTDNKTECINTLGSYECLCKEGFMEVNRKCVSDDMCMGVECDPNALCDPIRGCLCKPGYQGNGRACVDDDECDPSRSPCDLNATCTNTDGSYNCHCSAGFTGDGSRCQRADGTCVGIRCHPDAKCEQGAGGVSVCVCKPGYRGDGRECSADGTCAGIVCASDAECLTLPSDVSICKCKTGFFGNGLICKDIDECALRTHKCHKKANCQNTLGSYTCTCNLGYYGSGFNCSSDGTCEGVVCDLNADCVSLESIGGRKKECMCKPGFTGRGDICKDIDECEHPSVCPDKADCFNMVGSFMCYCLPGYKMIAENCIKDCSICLNGGSCDENNSCVCPPGFSGKRCQWHGEASLIFSKGNSIQRMSLPPRPNNIGIIYQRLGDVHVGLDYDCIDQRVYWTEVRKGVIARGRYDGSEIEVVVQNEESGSPEGIAVDWLGRNIYWTDSRLGVIQVARINGSDRRTLVSSDLANPRAIIVDPPNGKMYWTDWSQKQPKIEVANMDGTNRRILVKSSLGLPNGLTLVHSTNELCYSDAGTSSISCVNLGDLNVRKAYNPVLYPFGITNFNRTLFWTDWKLGRIQRMGIHSRFLDKPLRCFLGMRSSGKIFDIKAVQPCGKRTVASYQNPCATDNGQCLGLCLLKPESYSCLCPDGFYPEITANVTKCEAKCKSALGMQTFIIKNEQISASSAWNNNRQQYGSSRARLHLDTWPPGWRAEKNDLSPWLQIDLVQVHIVTAVATQGYGDEKEREWVKTYLLTTSRDGQKWISYKERRRKRVFIGNMDAKSVVQNQLKMPITTRWLRIVPRSWNNHIGMRVELYGC